jgi:hypothetical protein
VELPPVANIIYTTVPTGTTPHTITFSPTGCIPGSFPIDRIDWDFGDGTPIVTHTRYAPPSGTNITYNNKFTSDINDVRNYDITHTYIRGVKTYPVFYPSLTCYSANTNTQDSCSTTVGPISLPNITDNLNLIKARNSIKGNFYVFDIDENIGFLTTAPKTSELTATLISTSPNNRFSTTSTTNDTLSGNPNYNLFPPTYIPSCNYIP